MRKFIDLTPKCLVIYLSLMFSVSLLASNPPPDHYSKSLTDLVLRTESYQEDLEDPTYSEKIIDLIRLYQSTTDLHITLAELTRINNPALKYEQLEYAFTVWRAGSIPTLAIDHPALWGWQMHLLGDLLNGQRNLLMAREYFSEETAKKLALRRDEAYLLAAQYR